MREADTLGGFIRAARKRARLSGHALAERIHFSRVWLYRLERGGSVKVDDKALAAIADALELSPPETRYLYMLGERMPPRGTSADPPTSSYIDALLPHPAAWITLNGSGFMNSEFHRLFPGAGDSRGPIWWHFGDLRAHEAIVNWAEIARWWVSTARFGLAANPTDAELIAAMTQLLELPDFRLHWDAQVIPEDPVSRVWHVRDGRAELSIDMRLWRHAHWPGLFLVGVVI